MYTAFSCRPENKVYCTFQGYKMTKKLRCSTHIAATWVAPVFVNHIIPNKLLYYSSFYHLVNENSMVLKIEKCTVRQLLCIVPQTFFKVDVDRLLNILWRVMSGIFIAKSANILPWNYWRCFPDVRVSLQTYLNDILAPLIQSSSFEYFHYKELHKP